MQRPAGVPSRRSEIRRRTIPPAAAARGSVKPGCVQQQSARTSAPRSLALLALVLGQDVGAAQPVHDEMPRQPASREQQDHHDEWLDGP